MPAQAVAPRPGLFAITWPILSEHLLHASVSLLLVWLFSAVSDATAATYGLSTQIIRFFFILFRIVSMGSSVVITQHLGAGDREGAERIARASLWAAVWMGVASALVTVLAADFLLDLMKAPAELKAQATAYMLLAGWTLVADSINATAAAVLRANTYTRDAMRLILVSQLISVGAAVPLMLGWFGLPRLGLIGAGFAFLFAGLCLMAMNFTLWRRRLGIVPRLTDWFVPHWQRLAQVMHIGLPGGGENVVYRICFMINLAFVAVIGAEALATHTYLLQIAYFILLSGLAIGFGTEIVVGHHVGAGQLKMADRVVIKALQYGLCSSVLLALVAALAGPQIMGLFSSDAVVVSMGVKVLWVLVCLEPGRTFNLVVINGLRAAGDARFPVAFGVFSMVAVGVGLAWLLGVHLGWGLVGIWIGFAADEWVRGLAMFARWRYLAWVPHAKRTRRQIKVQQAD